MHYFDVDSCIVAVVLAVDTRCMKFVVLSGSVLPFTHHII